MSQALYYVGVDVGGQSIKGGVVADAGKPLSSVNVPTEADKGQEHGLAQMAEAVRRAVAAANLKLADIAAIGVATPGTMDIPAGLMLEPVNMPTWKNVAVRQYIEDTFQKPTAFQNDANAAAYGEYWAGAGRGCRSLVLFTLGTGIGCGIIVNDFIIEGEHSHGAEVGHVVIEMTSKRLCGCGQYGCLEAYASATAIAKRAKEALAADPGKSTLHDLLRASGDVRPEDVGTIFLAAAQGDAVAELLVDETAYALAIGAVNMVHTINPSMIVYGGGMTAAGAPFLNRIQSYAKKKSFPVPAARTQMVYAALGTDAGFIGAAGCARHALNVKP